MRLRTPTQRLGPYDHDYNVRPGFRRTILMFGGAIDMAQDYRAFSSRDWANFELSGTLLGFDGRIYNRVETEYGELTIL